MCTIGNLQTTESSFYLRSLSLTVDSELKKEKC